MADLTLEQAFEVSISEALASQGWIYDNEGNSAGFNPELALYPEDVAWWLSTQYPQEWEKVVPAEPGSARDAVVHRIVVKLAELLDKEPKPDLTKGGTRGGLLGILNKGFRFQQLGGKSAKFGPMATFFPDNPLITDKVEKAENNRLRVLRQVRFDAATSEAIDMVLLLNGIPIVTMELKTDNTQSVKAAIRQYKLDRMPSKTKAKRRLLNPGRALVHFAVSNSEVYMTTKLAGEDTTFLPFNKGNGEHAGNPTTEHGSETAYLWQEILAPHMFLRILQSYAVWDPGKGTGRGNLIFPRFHQQRAVEKVIADIEQGGPGRRYLIQHSAGSGKTMTISWLAHRLARHHSGETKTFDSVIVISDRKVLDRNLREGIGLLPASEGLVVNVGVGGGPKNQSLARALEAGNKIITCTVRTFPEVVARIQRDKELGKRTWCVIADEAHSGQTGKASRALRELLASSVPTGNTVSDEDEEADLDDFLEATDAAIAESKNITFVAFTATPKAKTVALFGTPTPDKGPQPFDVYSMAQAIGEGFILDVLTNYTPYSSFIRVKDAMGRTDMIDKGEVTNQIVRYARAHPTAIAQKVAVVVEHFRHNVMPLLDGQARAMVVTGGRLEAVRWHNEMEAYIRRQGYTDVHTLTAFSGKLTDENGQEHTEANINPPEVRDVETSFKDAHGPYRVLIVADKFQTGFDERRLCAMYVDKKLSGVATVQTLSRLNRIYDGKTDPIVLDFANDPTKVLEDFQLYYKSASLPDNVDPSILFEVADDLDAAGIYTEADMDAVAEIYFKTKDTTGHENFRDRLKHPIERWNDQINAARRAKPQDNETIQRLLDFRAKLRTYVKSWEFLSQIVNFEDPSMVKRAVVAKYLYRNLHVDDNDDEIVDIAGVDVIGARVGAATDPMNLGLTDGDGELGGLEVPTFGGGGAAKPGSETLAAFDEAVDEANQILEAAGIPTNTPVMRSFVLNLYEMLQQEESLQEMARENTREQLEQAPALSDELSSALFTLMTANEQLGELFTGDMVSIDKLRKVMATLLSRAANDNAQ